MFLLLQLTAQKVEVLKLMIRRRVYHCYVYVHVLRRVLCVCFMSHGHRCVVAETSMKCF